MVSMHKSLQTSEHWPLITFRRKKMAKTELDSWDTKMMLLQYPTCIYVIAGLLMTKEPPG